MNVFWIAEFPGGDVNLVAVENNDAVPVRASIAEDVSYVGGRRVGDC